MKPIGSIKTAPWLSAPETKTIVSALQAKGQNIRFVGGCVRDTLFSGPTPKKNPDIDIATPDSPQEVIRLLEDASIKYIPSGIKYGTITAVVKNYVFEITSLRTDVKTYGRHADVTFINDWMQDAARRDFTINAMMVNSLGDLYDPWNGIKDLEMGVVRFIGNANDRIQEDHLRILRFFRFHAWYGSNAPDPAALKACANGLTFLKILSGDRIRKEMLKILSAPDPSKAIESMAKIDVLKTLIPEAAYSNSIQDMLALETSFKIEPLRRLAALILNSGKQSYENNLLSHWKLSNRQKKRLHLLLSKPSDFGALLPSKRLRKLIYIHGKETVVDWLILSYGINPKNYQEYHKILSDTKDCHTPRFPVTGDDLLDTGLEQGPQIGNLLKKLEDWWIEHNFAPTRSECLKELQLYL